MQKIESSSILRVPSADISDGQPPISPQGAVQQQVEVSFSCPGKVNTSEGKREENEERRQSFPPTEAIFSAFVEATHSLVVHNGSAIRQFLERRGGLRVPTGLLIEPGSLVRGDIQSLVGETAGRMIQDTIEEGGHEFVFLGKAVIEPSFEMFLVFGHMRDGNAPHFDVNSRAGALQKLQQLRRVPPETVGRINAAFVEHIHVINGIKLVLQML